MNKHFQISPFALVLLIIFAILLAYFWQQTLERNNPTENSNVFEVWAILRTGNDGSGNWYLIDDGQHTPHNIAKFEQKDSGFIITYTEPFNKIHWSSVSPDETLILEDVDIGASVGIDAAIIYLAKDGEPVSPADLKVKNTNLWFYAKGTK